MLPGRNRHGPEDVVGPEQGGRLAIDGSLPAGIVGLAEDEQGGGRGSEVIGET
jgi:hypothetical protein